MKLDKNVVKDLKDEVLKLSLRNVSKNDVKRELKLLYMNNVRKKTFSYETYIKATALLILWKSLHTTYVVK